MSLLEKECERIPILENEIVSLQKEVEIKDKKIEELERRLNQNSTNSHSAPSKDPIKIKAAKQRNKGGKRGGQKKHKGSTLEKSEFIDKVEIHKPTDCECGEKLKDVKSKLLDTRQEFDISIRHDVIEHQRHIVKCPCCNKINKGVYPEYIKANTQYGPNIKAFCLLGNIEYKLPYGKLAEMVSSIFKLQMSEGTICNFISKGAKNLVQVEEEIKEEILKAEVLHADETGMVVDLHLMWMHVLSNSRYTYLRIHDNRGGDALDELIKKYEGHLVHDFFKSYFKLESCWHNPCGSHITRELDALIENKSLWAERFKKLYYELYHEEWGENVKNKKKIERRFRRIIKLGKQEEPSPERNGSRGQAKKSKGLNLILRLEKYMDEVLEFAFNPIIPFTNNQAERDLRHGKIKQKVSGCFRSLSGAQYYARIMSVISTLKKQSFDVFESFVTLFKYNSLTLVPE